MRLQIEGRLIDVDRLPKYEHTIVHDLTFDVVGPGDKDSQERPIVDPDVVFKIQPYGFEIRFNRHELKAALMVLEMKR